MRFTWDDELLAAGHRSGLAALGREGEAGTFTRRFVREKLPALRAPGAATRLDYGEELRDLLGPVGDRELEEFGIAARVDAIVLSGEVGVRKPERAIFERALAELDVAAAAALFVGD